MRKTRLKLLVIFLFVFAGALALLFVVASNDGAYTLNPAPPDGEYEQSSKPRPLRGQ